MRACRSAAARGATAVVRRVHADGASYAALLVLGMALLSSGCAALRRPAVSRLPSRLPSAAELEAVLTQRREALHSLRAVAHVRYHDPEESNRSRDAIVVARPDRLRVEVLSLFGSVFVLTASDGTLAAYAPQEHTVYRGEASPENLWRYVRLALPVGDLVDIILGAPPARAGGEPQVTFDGPSGEIRLRQPFSDGAQIVSFSLAELPVAAEEQAADGRTQWHARFGGYEDHNGLPLATHIAFELPEWQRSFDIALEDVDVNPTLDPSIFALQTPPGSKVVNLDRVAD